jgi:protein O-mannosyl-transferase
VEKSRLLRAASVLGLAFLSFCVCLPNEFVFDDNAVFGQTLTGLTSPSQVIWQPWLAGNDWRPFGLLFLYAERQFFGDWVPAFRITGLLLHGLAALALLRLLRSLTDERVAWLSALLFAAHPAHAEAVSMAYGQLELLAALFTFLALDRYVNALRADSLRQLLPALAFTLLAACSKESAIMLFALALLIRGFFLRPNEPWRNRWFSKFELLLAIPAAIVFLLRTLVLGHIFDPTPALTSGYPLAARIKTVIVVLGTMVKLSLFPTGQTLHYGHLRFAIFGHPWTQIAWIAAAAVLVVAAARDIGWQKVLFGASWFVVGLFPVLNIVPARVLVAERNLYTPIAGVIFVAASWVCEKRPWHSFQRVTVLAVLAICVAAGNAVVLQWRDEETVWRSAIRAHPDSPMAHLFLAEQLVHVPGREEEAGHEYRKALQLNPGLESAKRGLEALGRN